MTDHSLSAEQLLTLTELSEDAPRPSVLPMLSKADLIQIRAALARLGLVPPLDKSSGLEESSEVDAISKKVETLLRGNVDRTELHKILQSRFEMHTPIYHPPRGSMVTPDHFDKEHASDKAALLGIDFGAFFTLLSEIGYWKSVGPELERRYTVLAQRHIDWDTFTLSFEDPDIYLFFNVLQDGIALPNKKLFPHLATGVRMIERDKYHDHKEAATGDILTLLAMQYLEREPMSNELVTHYGQELNDTVDNDTRINVYQALVRYGITYPIDERGASAINSAHTALVTPTHHRYLYADASTGRPDVIIIQYHFDLEASVQNAIRLSASHVQPVQVMPLGGHAPHQRHDTATLDMVNEPSEAEEMIAHLLLGRHHSLLAGMPDRDDLEILGSDRFPIGLIIPGEAFSDSTESNAANVTRRLTKLRYTQGRPLDIVISTSREHIPRSFLQFRRQIPPEIARTIKISGADNHFSRNIATNRKINAVGLMIAEYLKLLYGIFCEQGYDHVRSQLDSAQ